MPVFQRNKFPSKANSNTFAARYRAMMAKHPFALFGLPFLAVIVGGSFVLTPATAIRYERHDRRVRQLTREEELNVGKGGRKVDMREEYYVSLPIPAAPPFPLFRCPPRRKPTVTNKLCRRDSRPRTSTAGSRNG